MSYSSETSLPEDIQEIEISETEKAENAVVRPELPETVLYANLKGNGAWPQSDLGMGMYTMAAVFKNEIPLEELFQSAVSKAQVDRLVTAMSGYHAKGNINYDRNNYDYERVSGLGNASKPIFVRAAYFGNRILFDKDSRKDLNTFFDDPFNKENYQYVLDFFAQPEVAPLKVAIETGVDYLNSDEGKELSRAYTSSLYELHQYEVDHDYPRFDPKIEELTNNTINIIKTARTNLIAKASANLDSADPNYEHYLEFLEAFVNNIGFTSNELLRENRKTLTVSRN